VGGSHVKIGKGRDPPGQSRVLAPSAQRAGRTRIQLKLRSLRNQPSPSARFGVAWSKQSNVSLQPVLRKLRSGYQLWNVRIGVESVSFEICRMTPSEISARSRHRKGGSGSPRGGLSVQKVQHVSAQKDCWTEFYLQLAASSSVCIPVFCRSWGALTYYGGFYGVPRRGYYPYILLSYIATLQVALNDVVQLYRVSKLGIDIYQDGDRRQPTR
jgi:hypothetical protein